jgi:hypothetical protein
MTVMACVADVSIIPRATPKAKHAAFGSRKKFLKKIYDVGLNEGNL